MFEDALLESGGRMKTHRAAATFASLLMQSALVGLLLLMPLIFVDALPRVKPVELPPTAPAPQGPEQVMQIISGGGSELDSEGRLLTPPAVPNTVTLVADSHPPGAGPTSDSPSAPDSNLFGNRIGGNDPNSVLRDIVSGHAAAPVAPLLKPLHVPSIFMQGMLVHRVVPPYPHIAKATGLQGAVVMHAVISRDGAIEKLQVVSGHPMLRRAALDAVGQWRYRPYILNGQPVEVETQITFNFVLSKD